METQTISNLPQRSRKYYPTKLLSTGKEIRYSKMTIGQQKTIMMLETEKETKSRQFKALISIISDCVDGVDINKITKTDFQKLVYDIRASSDGNVIKFQFSNVRFKKGDEFFKYEQVITENFLSMFETREEKVNAVRKELDKYERVTHITDFEINLHTDIEVTTGKFEDDLMLDDLKIHLKAPTVDQIQRVDERDLPDAEKEIIYRMLCIDYIADESRVYKDFSFDEMVEYFDKNISNEEFEKIDAFYNQIPKIVTNKDFNCSKWTEDVLVPKGKGLEDFL